MAQTTDIRQIPVSSTPIPVGQELMYVVENDTAVANEARVKYCADVYIHTTTPTLTTPSTKSNGFIGTFKTTPNAAGVGMFDFRNVVENYVNSDSIASINAEYKGTANADFSTPMHLIDKFSRNYNSFRYMAIQFYVEYLNKSNDQVEAIAGTEVNTTVFSIFNGYVSYIDDIYVDTSVFPRIQSYADTQRFVLSSTASDQFLTNAPVEQYANVDDYGTVAMLLSSADLTRVKLEYTTAAGASGGSEYINRTYADGAFDTYSIYSEKQLIYLGCFPGNLQNFSSQFVAANMLGGKIEVTPYDGVTQIGKTYTININCPNNKGYESIRLAWVNKWGAWDYYTFTKKSIRTIAAKGTTYTQLGGTWGSNFYKVASYRGGKKSFRVNATEKITMNTGFVTENDNVMFEELINSPEVYLLKGYQSGAETTSALNRYVQPIRITSSSFTTKTIANDKLIQYTFEIEKSKMERTQSI